MKKFEHYISVYINIKTTVKVTLIGLPYLYQVQKIVGMYNFRTIFNI